MMKNKQLINNSFLYHALSEGKLKACQKKKLYDQGCIRKQMLSPNNQSRYKKSDSKDNISCSKIITSPKKEILTTILSKAQKQRMLLDEDSLILKKIRSMFDGDKQKQNKQMRKYESQQSELKKKIEINEVQSQYIDKLKEQIQSSYVKLKNFEKRLIQNEDKNIKLSQVIKNLESQLIKIKQKLTKKQTLIFSLEQRIDILTEENLSLHNKNQQLQLQIISKRNQVIHSLKSQIMQLNRNILTQVNIESKPINDQNLKKQKRKDNKQTNKMILIQKIKAQIELNYRKKEKQMQGKIQLLQCQIRNIKIHNSQQIKKVRQQSQLHFLYLQASTIQGFLKN